MVNTAKPIAILIIPSSLVKITVRLLRSILLLIVDLDGVFTKMTYHLDLGIIKKSRVTLDLKNKLVVGI